MFQFLSDLIEDTSNNPRTRISNDIIGALFVGKLQGPARFVGRNFCHTLLPDTDLQLLSPYALTDVENLRTPKHLKNNPRDRFARGGITDNWSARRLSSRFHPRCVVNFASGC